MKKALKIVVLTNSLDGAKGGWARYSKEVASGLSNLGVELHVFSEDNSDSGYRLVSYPSILGKMLALIVNNLRIKRKVPDFEFAHAFTEPNIFLAWFLGRPYFLTLHGTYALRLVAGLRGFFVKRILSQAQKLIFISDFTKIKFQSVCPEFNNLIFIPNGVDIEKFKDNPNSKKNKTILTVGAIKSRKAQDFVVEAVMRLRTDFPELNYLIVGDSANDNFNNKLKDTVVINNLPVQFKEKISDEELVELYSEAMVTALPSRTDKGGSFEGFPLSLLEAASCGSPLIGSLGCGAEYIIKDGQNGFLIREDDIEGLVGAVKYFLINPEASGNMGRESRLLAQGFSWENHSKKLINIYNERGF